MRWRCSRRICSRRAARSALAAPGYYYDDPGYYYAPDVYAGPDASAEAYCAQRYRSYDPASGTFLGYDGVRRPCP